MVEHESMESLDRQQSPREDISAEEIISLRNRYKFQNYTGFVFFKCFSLYKKRMAVIIILPATESNGRDDNLKHAGHWVVCP